MSRIRSTGNRDTELKLIAIFRAHNIHGWRRRQPLPGKPDFVFIKERVCVFVDGCFWHGCPKHCRMPKSRKGFWKAKIPRNRARDVRVRKLLNQRRWRVLRFWEHDLNNAANAARKVRAALASPPLSR